MYKQILVFFLKRPYLITLLMLTLLLIQDDTPELLASDVHAAGAGVCNDAAVMKLAVEGPQRVEEVLLSGTAEVRRGRKTEDCFLCFQRLCYHSVTTATYD